MPALLSLIGLGIFRAGLEYYLYYIVLALGAFIVNFLALLYVPIYINYIVKYFIRYIVKVSVAISIY